MSEHESLQSDALAQEVRLKSSLTGHWVCLGDAEPLKAYLLKRLSAMECPNPQGWPTLVEEFLKQPNNKVRFRRPKATAHGQALQSTPFDKIVTRLKTSYDKLSSISEQKYAIIRNPQPEGQEADLSVIVTGVPVEDTACNTVQTMFTPSWRGGWNTVTAQGVPLGIYAQQLMVGKPPRRFVVTFSIKGRSLRLFVFDRCGALYSDAVDLHDHPDFLVYAALVALADPASVGVDPTVVQSPTGWFISLPAPTFADPTTADVGPFEVNSNRAWAVFPLLEGGTTCWWTQDGRYIVKDFWSWGFEHSEGKFLMRLAGVKGVGQLHAYQDCMENVSRLRGGYQHMSIDGGRSTLCDRVHSRLVLHAYTGDLSHAPNPLALLIGFRDAVIGHRNALIDKHIYHRDIKVANLMFDEQARDGLLGRLIDFGSATTLEDLQYEYMRYQIGTPAYQSCKVLAAQPGALGPPDHMDELESFFYVLLHISIMHQGGAEPMAADGGPEIMDTWCHTDVETGKLSFMLERGWSQPLSDGLSDLFLPLLKELREFFRPRLERIQDVIRAPVWQTGRCRTPLCGIEGTPEDLSRADQDYGRFVEIVNEHIERIKGGHRDWDKDVDALLSRGQSAPRKAQEGREGERCPDSAPPVEWVEKSAPANGGAEPSSRKRNASCLGEDEPPVASKRLREE